MKKLLLAIGILALGAVGSVLPRLTISGWVQPQPLLASFMPPVDPVFGVLLPNAAYVSLKGSTAATGDLDLYTVPAGRKAIIVGSMNFFNNAGGSTIQVYPELKVSATYYRLKTNTAVSNNSNTQAALNNLFVFDAGDVIALGTTVASPLNYAIGVVTFDSTSKLKNSRILGPSTGDNTVYTCPASTTAVIIGQFGFGGNSTNANGGVSFVADSGGTRNITANIVPSGGTVGVTNKFLPSTAVTASNNSQALSPGFILSAGDFINVNVDVGNAAQVVWASLIER